MGLLLKTNEYGELADAVANDGAAAMLGAMASEAIGKVTEWFLKDSPNFGNSHKTLWSSAFLQSRKTGGTHA
jgi:hypothetical protein